MESPSSKAGPSPRRGLGRALVAPLLAIGLVLTLIFWFLAATNMNLFMNRITHYLEKEVTFMFVLSTFAGNIATIFLMLFSLIAGVAALASFVVGIHHLVVWTRHSASAAQATGWIAFFFLLVPFGLVWKQINLGGHLGHKPKAVGALVVIVTFVQFLYVVILYATI